MSEWSTKERKSNQWDARSDETISLQCGLDKNSTQDTDFSRHNEEVRMTASPMMLRNAVSLT